MARRGAEIRNSTKRQARQPIRSRRICFRATDPQEALIRGGAVSAGMTMTDFILESACLRAEQDLLDKRAFVAPARRWNAFIEMLDRPALANPKLARVFSELRS